VKSPLLCSAAPANPDSVNATGAFRELTSVIKKRFQASMANQSIPESKIEEIRDATDIVDLISGYVTLKKKGQNHFGLCPFHQEKTPSFSVNAAKQIFHCFGCNAGGNAFTFLMRHEGLSFPEAAKFLAQKAGIVLEFEAQDATEAKAHETLYYVNEFAAKFFHESLLSPAGKAALSYLKERGIPRKDIGAFELGYAPPEWDSLLKAAKSSFDDKNVLLTAGLILEKEGTRYYDRFRDRIMFPIKNLSGRVVAFGGRILTASERSPKYINSPETPVYEKGKILYGLYHTRDAIRKAEKAIVVEGYMDFLSLVAAGFGNTVATLGTALTEDQARLIRRYTRSVVLMYDSDSAGTKATLRGADVLLEAGVDVAVVHLPDGHDPDSFVRAHGIEKLQAHIDRAENIFDYKLTTLQKTPAEKRGEGIRALLVTLGKVSDRIERNLLLSKLAERLKVSEKVLWTELEAIIREQRVASGRQSTIGKQLNDLSALGKTSKLDKAVEDLVRILIHNWEMAPVIFANLDLAEAEGTGMYTILRFLCNRFKGGKAPTEEELVHHSNDVALTSFIVAEINRSFDRDTVDVEKWALDCVVTIRKETVQAEIDRLRQQIRTAASAGPEVQELLKRCMELENYKMHLSTAAR